MILKKFRFRVFLQVIFIFLEILLFSYLILQTSLYATMAVVLLVIIFQTYGLIRYVEKTNQHLVRFFEAVEHADFSQSFSPTGLGSVFDELKESFSRVIEAFQRNRSEKEENFRYLQTVVQHIGIGLIAFNSGGEVELINTAAKRLLKINLLKHIDMLASFSPELVNKLYSIKSNNRALVKVYDDDELLQLAIYATQFKIRNRQITLVSLQNIQGELEEKEMEAWQNLIRVLTHEIMNSVTPISSLAATANQILKNNFKQHTDDDNLDDIRQSVSTIQKRSEGLLHFVGTYRNLTRLPKPNFQIIPVKEIFSNIERLMSAQIDTNSIKLLIRTDPESLEITADPELLEQVLINLVLNAAHALQNSSDGKIQIEGFLNDRGRVVLQVTDNGPGLLPEVQEKIFIPFFTTKKEGSGIGLSLCRQIMRLHRGTITVHSTPNVKTTFILRF
jgi:two-component system nitrogen regulation sensor histidine kinase NtrY